MSGNWMILELWGNATHEWRNRSSTVAGTYPCERRCNHCSLRCLTAIKELIFGLHLPIKWHVLHLKNLYRFTRFDWKIKTKKPLFTKFHSLRRSSQKVEHFGISSVQNVESMNTHGKLDQSGIRNIVLSWVVGLSSWCEQRQINLILYGNSLIQRFVLSWTKNDPLIGSSFRAYNIVRISGWISCIFWMIPYFFYLEIERKIFTIFIFWILFDLLWAQTIAIMCSLLSAFQHVFSAVLPSRGQIPLWQPLLSHFASVQISNWI